MAKGKEKLTREDGHDTAVLLIEQSHERLPYHKPRSKTDLLCASAYRRVSAEDGRSERGYNFGSNVKVSLEGHGAGREVDRKVRTASGVLPSRL